MFIYDLPKERDFFDTVCEVDFRFVYNLLNRKPFFQATSIGHDTIGTKLIATTRNRNVSRFIMLIHTGIDPLGNDRRIFVGELLIIANLVA